MRLLMMPRSFPSATAYAFAPNPSDSHPNSCLRESLDDTESRALHGCSHKLARLPAAERRSLIGNLIVSHGGSGAGSARCPKPKPCRPHTQSCRRTTHKPQARRRDPDLRDPTLQYRLEATAAERWSVPAEALGAVLRGSLADAPRSREPVESEIDHRRCE